MHISPTQKHKKKMNRTLKNKFLASGLHLLISAIIITVFLALIFFIWFPNNLFLAGASTGLTILIIVDVVLGPLLTFVVFNKEKKSLKFDLTCIALLQLGSFIYGAALVYQERPILQVLGGEGIKLVTISEAKEFEMETNYRFFSSPHYVLLTVPEKVEQYVIDKVSHEYTQGKPYNTKTELHVDMVNVSESTFNERIDFIRGNLLASELIDLNNFTELNPDKSCSWLPLLSYHVTGYACVNAKEGIVNFDKNSNS